MDATPVDDSELDEDGIPRGGWPRVAAAIAARMRQLSISKAELIRAARLSDKTLNRYLAGEPIKRIDKRRDLILALEWDYDTIDQILGGGWYRTYGSEAGTRRPEFVDPDALRSGHGGSEGWPPWLEDKFRRLEDRVAGNAGELADHAQQLEEMRGDLRRIRELLERGEESGQVP